MNTKKISELELLSVIPADGSVLIESGGAAKRIPASAVGAQSDWNQNDETAPDFIKSKTHYTEFGKVVLPEETVALEEFDGWYEARLSAVPNIELGKKYIVVFNGAVHHLYPYDISNESESGLCLEDAENYTFYINFVTYRESGESCAVIYTYEQMESCTISIKESDSVHPIDGKYLPDGYALDEIKENQLLMEEAQLAFYESDWLEGGTAYEGDSPFGLFIEGEKYTVVVDGVRYTDLVARRLTGKEEDCQELMIGANWDSISAEMPVSVYTEEEYDSDTESKHVTICIDLLSDVTSHNIVIEGCKAEARPMDERFCTLPSNVFQKVKNSKVIFSWDGQPTSESIYFNGDYLYKVTDELLLSVGKLKNDKYLYHHSAYPDETSSFEPMVDPDYKWWGDTYAVICAAEAGTFEDDGREFIVPSKGTYLKKDGGYIANIYEMEDSIGVRGIVLTGGSAGEKRFLLTVSDSGELVVEDVTHGGGNFPA